MRRQGLAPSWAPLTSLIYSAPSGPDDADNPVRTVVCGPMIPEIEEFEKRFGVNVITCLRAVRDGHSPGDRLGSRSLGQLWSTATGLPVGRGPCGQRPG